MSCTSFVIHRTNQVHVFTGSIINLMNVTAYYMYKISDRSFVGVTMKNSLPSESSENTVLDEIQYSESNGGNRFSIGRSMTKLCIKINQNCGATRARKLLSTNAELNEMDPKL